MTEDVNTPPSSEDIAKALRSLERKGIVVSKLCEDGQIRWFRTSKPHHERLGDRGELDA